MLQQADPLHNLRKVGAAILNEVSTATTTLSGELAHAHTLKMDRRNGGKLISAERSMSSTLISGTEAIAARLGCSPPPSLSA